MGRDGFGFEAEDALAPSHSDGDEDSAKKSHWSIEEVVEA